MQLAELMKEWPCVIKGNIRVEIQRVQHIVQHVQPGDLFLAKKGAKFNGEEAIEEAIQRGAIAIAVENELLAAQWKKELPIIWVPNMQQFVSYSYAKMARFPSEVLTVVAVTGTNGKTTVTHLIGQLLQHIGQRVVVIGTNGAFLNGERLEQFQETLTTWQPHMLQQIFHYCIEHKVPYVIMEASSMGLATYRLDHVAIKLGVFLNISREHIEDHTSFAQYKSAKQRLVTLSEKVIVNSDDTLCRSLLLSSTKKPIFFGTTNRAHYELQCLLEQPDYAHCVVQADENRCLVVVPFEGAYQRQNVLAAVTAVCELGFSLEQVCAAIPNCYLPTGRMQKIELNTPFEVVIDYAHTVAAMEAVLATLHKRCTGKLIVVFSCGGERDKEKRPKMGEVASNYANFIVLTTDNARSENPKTINAQIAEGFLGGQTYTERIDREEAITYALSIAQSGDIVVILGKGHEQTQTIAGETKPFSDEEVVRNYLNSTLNDKK